jgi:hypothetical protein
VDTVRFLAAHPSCRIGIRDEYGVEHPVERPVTLPLLCVAWALRGCGSGTVRCLG